jgi:light-regulated signal transduction histidine kinase (bacteriophytochrome)
VIDRSQMAGPEYDRAADVEQELASFSYIVSHDLAAVFRHVTEFSRMLVEDFEEGLTARQRSHAEHVNAATESCRAMMEQLLVFSRVQQRSPTPLWQDANAAIENPMLQLAQEARAAGAVVSIAALGQVYADVELLEVALHHLLDNAIKFRRPGVPPLIQVSATDDGRFWRLRVTDNGPGVEPRYRDKAMQMFHRLNGEGAFPGIGAGLAIARRIARRHGGEVAFLDSPTGACVELSLPSPERTQ